MGARTKIDWCDATWNPITGCYHGCEYCYARSIARRFDGKISRDDIFSRTVTACGREWRIHEAEYEVLPYPYGFEPTLHRGRLDIPQGWKKPKNIFVCSMADMYGRWVPDEWKVEVLKACAKAPQHRYLFLTKDPTWYGFWPDNEKWPGYTEFDAYTDNMWCGVTYTGSERLPWAQEERPFNPEEQQSRLGTASNFWYLWRMSGAITPYIRHRFLSVEPMRCDIMEVKNERDLGIRGGVERLMDEIFLKSQRTPFEIRPIFDWVIVGAETGNRKDKVKPRKEWVMKLAARCEVENIPLFMKESLRETMGSDFRQEFPW